MNDGKPFWDRVSWKLIDNNISSFRSLEANLRKKDVQSLAEEVLGRVAGRYSVDLPDEGPLPDPEDIDQLAQALVDEDEDAGLAFAMKLRATGSSVEDIYIAHLAASARRLGEWWMEDRLSFLEVTIGTSRIYGILRALDDMIVTPVPKRPRRAVFASVPGETHTLGVRTAANLFRQRGWEIDLLLEFSHEEILNRLQASEDTIIGLSSAGRHSIAQLAKMVTAIRINRPDMFVLISGNVVEEGKDLITKMTPDAMTNDLQTAISELEACG